MGMRDLGTPLIRLMGREHPYLTGDQKTQCVDGVPDRANVGDDGDALPLREVFDADAEDFPRCAGEAATDRVIEPDLVVPLQRGLHQRFHNLVAVLIGDPPRGDTPHDIVRSPSIFGILRSNPLNRTRSAGALLAWLIASFGTLTAAQGGRFFESLPCPECMRRVYRVGNPETAAKRIPTATAPQRPMGCSGSIQVSSGRSADDRYRRPLAHAGEGLLT